MEKMNLLNNYKSARSSLLAVIIFSVLNCFMLYFDMGYTFLYSMITPQLALIFAKQVFRGFTSVIVVVMFAIVPIALYTISYLLSNKDWKWLRVGTVLFATDILVFIGFFLKFGFDSSFILSIIFEGLIMFNLVRGTMAGKDLNNDFEVEEIVVGNTATAAEGSEETRVKIYSYDKEYAAKNSANKTLLVIGSFVIFILVMFVLTFLLNNIFKGNVFLMFVLLYGLLIGYAVWIVKMSPFIYAKNYQFFKKDGVVYRNYTVNNMIQSFADLKLEETGKDRFVCSYQKKEDKRKKLIIPNAYPDIEEIL